MCGRSPTASELRITQIPKSGTFNIEVDGLSPGVERNLRPENEINIYSGGQLVRLYADPGRSWILV
jgi:hypothetical protein